MKKLTYNLLSRIMAFVLIFSAGMSCMPAYAGAGTDPSNVAFANFVARTTYGGDVYDSNGDYLSSDAAAKMFYNEKICELGTDGYAGHVPEFSNSDFVKVWSQIYGKLNSGELSTSQVESYAYRLISGADNRRDDTDNTIHGTEDLNDSWILHLRVHSTAVFDAKTVLGRMTGLAIVICQQFGGAVLIVGFMQAILAMKDDNPALKDRGLRLICVGGFLVAIYEMLQLIEFIS